MNPSAVKILSGVYGAICISLLSFILHPWYNFGDKYKLEIFEVNSYIIAVWIRWSYHVGFRAIVELTLAGLTYEWKIFQSVCRSGAIHFIPTVDMPVMEWHSLVKVAVAQVEVRETLVRGHVLRSEFYAVWKRFLRYTHLNIRQVQSKFTSPGGQAWSVLDDLYVAAVIGE